MWLCLLKNSRQNTAWANAWQVHLFIDSGMRWSMMNENLHNFLVSFPSSQVNGKIALVVCYVCWCLILKQFENYFPKKKKKKKKKSTQQKRKYAEQHILLNGSLLKYTRCWVAIQNNKSRNWGVKLGLRICLLNIWLLCLPEKLPLPHILTQSVD